MIRVEKELHPGRVWVDYHLIKDILVVLGLIVLLVAGLWQVRGFVSLVPFGLLTLSSPLLLWEGTILQVSSQLLDHRCMDNTMVEIMAAEKAVSLTREGGWQNGVLLGDNTNCSKAMEDREYGEICSWHVRSLVKNLHQAFRYLGTWSCNKLDRNLIVLAHDLAKEAHNNFPSFRVVL